MPILATGNKARAPKRPDRDAGFSLVELLAVLAIVSLMIGAVVVNLPRPPAPLDRESEAMTSRINAFLDDGALAGEMRALGVNREAVVLFRFDGLAWAEADRMVWPDDARVQFDVEGDRENLPEIATPDLLFEPYGAVPDFSLTLAGRSATYVLRPNEQGDLIREDQF